MKNLVWVIMMIYLCHALEVKLYHEERNIKLIPLARDTPRCFGLFLYESASNLRFDNGTEVYTGRVEACVDGESLPVCIDGLNTTESQPSQETLDNICNEHVGRGSGNVVICQCSSKFLKHIASFPLQNGC